VSALDGLGVLVTRPEPEAARLANRLATLGARVYRLPAIELRARADRAAQRAALGPLDRFHWIVFVSANAVRFGISLLGERRSLQLAAVGPATATALNHAGFRVNLVPTDRFDSEGLLATPEFTHVAGQRILIIRGTGGREYLAEQLRDRGAEVSYAEVYERRPARLPPGAVQAVEAAWAGGEIDIVTATSVELLRALVELLSPAGRSLLSRCVLLAGGPRIAAAAREAGLAGPLVVADGPDDDNLVAALSAWRLGRDTPGH
jgi:uroporphyrinogen-III synthase